jgi:hypothetical protein
MFCLHIHRKRQRERFVPDYTRSDRNKSKHVSWANLKGDGYFDTKEGNGEQMLDMVSGLGSVIGYPRPTPRERRHGAYGHKCMQVS